MIDKQEDPDRDYLAR